MTKQTITLYTMSWNGYWDRYGKTWSEYINNLNTKPDEIIIVSDEPLDTSTISITDNVKNVIVQSLPAQSNVSYYRNTAIENASSEWIVASDIDDIPFENYLDELDDDADIHAFSFIHGDTHYYPDKDSLADTVTTVVERTNIIPGTSAIKKYFFKNLKYENGCHEDNVFYSMAYLLNPKVSFDNKVRFEYSGWHSNKEDITNTTKKYKDMILGKDRSLFVCWFSDSITDSRKKALRVLARSCNVDIRLITKRTIYDYENPGLPIHKAFQFLTDVDKSDYARAYLMYFYGGGYSDIKANQFDWNTYFDQLLSSRHDAIGYAEENPEDVAVFWKEDSNISSFVEDNYKGFAGNGHFIFKPRTRFAYDWIMAIHKIMDDNYDQLKKSPGVHPYMVKGGFHVSYSGEIPKELDGHGYPFDWTTIGGTTRHRLEYEHGLAAFKKGMPFPNMTDYR